MISAFFFACNFPETFFLFRIFELLKIVKKLKLATKEPFSLIGQVCNFRIEDAIGYEANPAEILVDDNLKQFDILSAQFKTASKAEQQKILDAMKTILQAA